jgi:ABC-type ATPase with predicted acetyltransferase domain
MLSRVGLAEAWTYLRTPRELSEGQRWRLKVAIAIANADARARDQNPRRTILICDEFAAVLDRVTACVVARALRRTIDSARGISAILATSHDDLIDALRPDLRIKCDFGTVHVSG